jgi:hypothetical protein
MIATCNEGIPITTGRVKVVGYTELTHYSSTPGGWTQLSRERGGRD